LTIPEYGFTSKIYSAQKKKKFVPTTPAKKNLKAQRNFSGKPLINRFGLNHSGIKNNSGRGSDIADSIDDIYSPIANLLKFSEK